MAGLLSIRGPEVRQKDFLSKRCVRITVSGEEWSSLKTGKVREEVLGIVMYNTLLTVLVSLPWDVPMSYFLHRSALTPRSWVL